MLYSEEASQFEHPKHMLNIMVKKILQFYTEFFSLCKPVYNVGIFYFERSSSHIRSAVAQW